jgi:hypothetical protein
MVLAPQNANSGGQRLVEAKEDMQKSNVFEWSALVAQLERHPWVCFAEGDPPSAPAPAATPPAPAAAPAPTEPAPITLTSEQLKERMDRHTAAQLTKLGIDPEQAKKDRDELAKLKAAEEERKKAEMTELDRLKAEKAEADAKAEAAERAVAAAQDQAAIIRLCAENGVKDVAYAEYRLKTIPEAERAGKLAEWLKDDVEKARFAVGGAAPAKPPAQTTTTTPAGAPPPAPAPGAAPGAPGGGGGPPAKPVDDMTDAEYRAHKQSAHGLG